MILFPSTSIPFLFLAKGQHKNNTKIISKKQEHDVTRKSPWTFKILEQKAKDIVCPFPERNNRIKHGFSLPPKRI